MRKIALIGTAPSGAEAPFGDESWEIWGVASRMQYVTRADRWFELHRLSGESPDFQRNWRKDIRRFSSEVELYMFYPEPDLGPKVIPYPYQHIVDRFGTYFMTSSFSWMLAMAIDELRPVNAAPEEGMLGVWGVDMEYGTEYRQQRAGFKHFVDLARAWCIPVTRFLDSGLSFEPVPYPLWQDDPLQNKLTSRMRENRAQIEKLNTSLRHTRSMIAQNRMVISELKALLPTLDAASVGKRITALDKELDRLMDTSATLSKDIVHHDAIDEEQRWLDDYLSP